MTQTQSRDFCGFCGVEFDPDRRNDCASSVECLISCARWRDATEDDARRQEAVEFLIATVMKGSA